MVQDTYRNGVGSSLQFCSGLHMRGLFRLTPSRSAQVRLSLPRSIPTPRFSQVLPGSPRSSQVLPGSPRFWWFPAILWVSGISWENLGVIFCDFVGFPGYPGRTWVETVGDGPGRAARVSSGQSGWRVAHYFDPQFLNFCRRCCRPLWPAGLPRFKV